MQFLVYTLVLTAVCGILFYVFEKPLKKRVIGFLEKPANWSYLMQRMLPKK
jgi:hypothetical protein